MNDCFLIDSMLALLFLKILTMWKCRALPVIEITISDVTEIITKKRASMFPEKEMLRSKLIIN